MRAILVGSNELRFEAETAEEQEFLSELQTALSENRNAHYEMFCQVYPWKGFFARLFQYKRSSLWRKWLTISPRVRSALFHDNSLILSVMKNTEGA